MWHNKRYYQQAISVKTLRNLFWQKNCNLIINEKCLDSSQAYECLQAWADAPLLVFVLQLWIAFSVYWAPLFHLKHNPVIIHHNCFPFWQTLIQYCCMHIQQKSDPWPTEFPNLQFAAFKNHPAFIFSCFSVKVVKSHFCPLQ